MCTSTPHNQVLAVMILAQASNTRPTGLIRVRRAITQVWISVQTEQLCRRRSAPILQYLHKVTFFAIKTNTSDPNGEGNACNNEHAGNISLDSDHTRGDKGGKLELPIYKRSISAQDIDALEVIKIPSHHQLCRDRQADTCSSRIPALLPF
ncbi:uncharacterized protein [Physcomitrium patens]